MIKMQEKTEKKSERVHTEERETAESTSSEQAPQRSAIWRRRTEWIVQELVFGVMGYLLCGCEMFLGTYPLGFAFLCASGGHTLSILAGTLLAAITRMPNPIVYICVSVAAALVRGVSGMILENPDARMELPMRIRRKLKRVPSDGDGEDAKAESEPYSNAEKTGAEQDEHSDIERNSPSSAVKTVKGSFLDAVGSIFTEGVILRMVTGAIGALLISLGRVFSGGFQYYDFFAAVFLVLFTPALILLLSVCLGSHVKNAFLRTVSETALLFALILSASSLPEIGIPLGGGIAYFCILTICARRGIVLGCASALPIGLAFDPMQIPSFLFAALVFSLLHSKEKESGGILLGGATLLCWSAYVRGAVMIPVLLPSVLIAGAVFSILEKWKGTDMQEKETDKQATESRDAQLAHARCRDANDRFRGISEAFTSLSEMFYNLSDRFRRPGTLDLRQICDRAFDECCRDCPNKTVCWGLEYSSTLSTVNVLISQLHTRGKVTREQIPSPMKRRCKSIGVILEKINTDCARLTADMLRNNRTEIFAMDYEAAANIINDALEEDAGEYRFDTEMEQKVRDYLKDAGITVCNVSVYGNRRRQIVLRGVNVDNSKVSAQTLRSDLGEMCGLELGQPVFEVDGKVSVMSMQAKKKIAVTGAQNNVSADGGVSGDSINLFSNKQDYFYALISDGMGAGKEAALTSGLCSVFLEKMLRAGNRAWTSLRMLNNMIRSRGADSVRECSSTIDLLELDLMTAQGSFIKSGAAPSFVVRGGTVHSIQVGTAPIGIIQTLDAQATPFQLRVGDTVVLISDGIMQNDEECEWLISFLAKSGELIPEEIVYRICLQAAAAPDHDDCSAVALRIIEAE